MSIVCKNVVEKEILPWNELLESFPSKTDKYYENAANLLYLLANEREIGGVLITPSITPEQAKRLAKHFKMLQTEAQKFVHECNLCLAFGLEADSPSYTASRYEFVINKDDFLLNNLLQKITSEQIPTVMTCKVEVMKENLSWEELIKAFPSNDVSYEKAANLLYAAVNPRKGDTLLIPPIPIPRFAIEYAEYFKKLKTPEEKEAYEQALRQAFGVSEEAFKQSTYTQTFLPDTHWMKRIDIMAKSEYQQVLELFAKLLAIRSVIIDEIKTMISQGKERAFGVSFWSRFSIPISENGQVRQVAVPEGIYQIYKLTDGRTDNPENTLNQIRNICEKRKETSFFDQILRLLGLGGRSEETAKIYAGLLGSTSTNTGKDFCLRRT